LPIFLLLIACSATETSQLIAEHPFDEAIASYPSLIAPEGVENIIYHASLLMEVRNVERAADKAILLAEHFNGYLVNSQSWFQNNEQYIHLVITVPVWYFEEMHVELLKLGRVKSEQISGDIIPGMEYAHGQYSHFTLQLHPKASAFGSVSLPDWRPIQTFQQAWGVFMAIFGFILDIVIWVLVVAGPFVLLGWLIKVWVSKWRTQSPTSEE